MRLKPRFLLQGFFAPLPSHGGQQQFKLPFGSPTAAPSPGVGLREPGGLRQLRVLGCATTGGPGGALAEGTEPGLPAAVRAVPTEHGLRTGAAEAPLTGSQVSPLPSLLFPSPGFDSWTLRMTMPLGPYTAVGTLTPTGTSCLCHSGHTAKHPAHAEHSFPHSGLLDSLLALGLGSQFLA